MQSLSLSSITNTFHRNVDTLKENLSAVQERVSEFARRVLFNPLTWTATMTASLTVAVIGSLCSSIVPIPFVAVITIVGLMCLGIMVGQHKKRLLFEISLTYNLVRNALEPQTYRWWDKITDNVILGAVPLKNKGHLDEIEADAVLMCLEDFEANANCLLAVPVRQEEWEDNYVDFLQIGAPDFQPLTQEQLNKGVEFIHQRALEGKTTYVHCKAGRGRSASVVICYLIKYKGMSIEEAVDHVQAARPQVDLKEKKHQMKTITDYANSLKA